jgi:hypothetical protein
METVTFSQMLTIRRLRLLMCDAKHKHSLLCMTETTGSSETLASVSWCQSRIWVYCYRKQSTQFRQIISSLINYYVYIITIWTLSIPCLLLRTRHFGDWILSQSSGGTYSVGPNRYSYSLWEREDRTMDNVQNCDSYTNIASSQTYR